MVKWIPSKKQKSSLISRTIEFFIDELAELHEEFDCPDEFISDFLEVVKNLWSPDSFISKASQHKRDYPSSY